MSRQLNLMMRKTVPAPFARATRVLKTELFERPLWYDVVKYAPPITYGQEPMQRGRKVKPRLGLEHELYSNLLHARPMLRLEPLNAASNTPSIGYRFVTTQLQLMRNDKLKRRAAFMVAMKALEPEIEAFEANVAHTGVSKFHVSKEKVLHNLGTMFGAAAPGSPAALRAAQAEAKATAAAKSKKAAADFAAAMKTASGGSILDPVPLLTSALAVVNAPKPKRAPALISEPVEVAPARAVARPVFYAANGKPMRAPRNLVEGKWAWGTDVESAIDPDGSQRAAIEARAGIVRDPLDDDVDGAALADLAADMTPNELRPFGHSKTVDDSPHPDRNRMRDPLQHARARAHRALAQLRPDLFPAEEADAVGQAVANAKAELDAIDADAAEGESDADALVAVREAVAARQRTRDAEAAANAEKAAKAAAFLRSHGLDVENLDSSKAAEEAVQDFVYDHNTSQHELDEYLDAKVAQCLPDEAGASDADKSLLRAELLYNIKLKRSYMSFEVLRQAILSNDDRKLDVVLRATYDDIFGFAKPFEEREVLRSIVYEVTRGDDLALRSSPGTTPWTDKTLGKQRVDLRVLLRQARDVRVAQEQQALRNHNATEGGSGAASGFGAALTATGGKVSLPSVLDALSNAVAGPRRAAQATEASREALRAAKIEEIKNELNALRRFSDQRWELAHYLQDQLQKKIDEAAGKAPTAKYQAEVQPIMTVTHWRSMLLTEADIMQRVLGVDAAPSYGTAEAQRLAAAGATHRFGDSKASAQFAPINNAGGHLRAFSAPAGLSGSASTWTVDGHAALPSFRTTGRHGTHNFMTRVQFKRLANRFLSAQDEEVLAARKSSAASAASASTPDGRAATPSPFASSAMPKPDRIRNREREDE